MNNNQMHFKELFSYSIVAGKYFKPYNSISNHTWLYLGSTFFLTMHFMCSFQAYFSATFELRVLLGCPK